MASDGISYAKISASTYGTLGIFSKRLVAICPAGSSDASGSAAASNTYQNTDGVYIDINRMWPIKNNSMSLGISNYKWSDLYATIISPSKVRINNTDTNDHILYVKNGSTRFYMGYSNNGVADRKFTISGGPDGNVIELSFGSEGILAFNNSQAVKNLFLLPRGGNLVFGQGSTISTTAYSFYPNQNDKHTLGSSSYKWANIYATTATLNGLSVVGGDIVMSEASGHGATHKLIFLRGTATDGYTNWKLYNDSVGVLTLQAYHNGLDADTDILLVLCPAASLTPALVPGTTNSYDIGSSSLVWRNIYATNLYGALATSNLTGQVAIANGGTGASDAANARTNLGLGTIAVKDTGDYYSIGSGCSTLVSSTQDFDTLTTFGNYYRTANADTANMTHLPLKQAFTLKVMSASGSDSRIRLVFQPYNKSIIYMRSKSSAADATWTAWQYQPIVTPTENDGTYTLTKGSASLPVYINSDGEIQSVSSLTSGGIVYGDASGAYASTAAGSSGQYLKSNGSNAPTWETLIGTAATNAAAGNHGHGNITNDGKCGSANRIIVTNSSLQMTTTALLQYDISNSTLTASGTIATKVLNVGPPTEAYANSLTGDINFYYDNSTNSTIRAHIGSSHSQDADASLFGLYATGAIVVRPGAAYDSATNRISTTAGIKFTSTTFEPSTTDTTSLGTSSLQWTTTYTKLLTVDLHVTLAYNSSDLSLEFNFG